MVGFETPSEALRSFQCDLNRSIEENFARILTEKNSVRVFFVNENQAFTDGRNIVVDPGVNYTFADRRALKNAEKYLNLPAVFSKNLYNALRIITRANTIHESLHIIYSSFPVPVAKDKRATTALRRRTLAILGNIIEDSFIEAVGCSVYDNLELFLKFERMAVLFSERQFEGTIERNFKIFKPKEVLENPVTEDTPTEDFTDGENSCEKMPNGMDILVDYLEYMGTFLLYPMVILPEPDKEIAEYVEKTKALFLEGSMCGDPDERYTYSERIFDIIEPLIPDIDLPDSEFSDTFDELEFLDLDTKTHDGILNTSGSFSSNGRRVNVTRRLFSDKDGNLLDKKNMNAELADILDGYKTDYDTYLLEEGQSSTTTESYGSEFDCEKKHRDIKIVVHKPKPEIKNKRAYQNILSKYKSEINRFSAHFEQILQAPISSRLEKQLFGSGIESRRLVDVHKRYWYRNVTEQGVPRLAVLILIDGSGSMAGERRSSAAVSSIIIHEVLKAQGITHAVVEHRAIYGRAQVEHNILVDFGGRENEKYNILSLDASDNTREGLSLYWAEKYIEKSTFEENRLIIALSDGQPCHITGATDNYVPPISVKDTRAAAEKIIKRGTEIVAVALSGKYDSCYDELCQAYPRVIDCDDLSQLPKQVFSLIAKRLS